MFFDARAAKLMQPGSHIVVHGCPGLRLEASATRKTWTYRFRSPVDGKLKQVKIGHWPAMSPAAAASQWAELRDRRDGGEDMAMTRKVERMAVKSSPEVDYTLGQLVEDYAAGHLSRARTETSAHATTLRIRKAVAKYADLPVTAISRRFAFDLIEGLAETPVMAASVKTELAAAWRYALNSGRINESAPNWWAEVKMNLRSKGAVRDGVHKGTGKRVLAEHEIRQLFTRDLFILNQQAQDFLTIQLWTCTRGVEICQMNQADLREVDGVLWWTMDKGFTKNRNVDDAGDLRVPLLGRARDVVTRLVPGAQKGWLFHSTDQKTSEIVHQRQVNIASRIQYFQPYSKARPDHQRQRFEVSHWSPHDLRRTGRTMLAALGCPHEIGESILGHVLKGVAGDYNLYTYDKERVHWLQTLADRLEQIIAA